MMALPNIQIPEINQIWEQAEHHINLAKEGRPPIENLVLEGGGVKGFGYIGALEVLAENGVLANVKRVAGSSAGGIVALLLAIGCEPPEIMKIMAKELDLKSLLDPINATDPSRFIKAAGLKIGISDIVSLFENKGLYKGDAFVEVAQKIVSNVISRKLFEVIKNRDHAIIQKMQLEGDSLETINEYLKKQFQELLEKYYITDLGTINFEQHEKLRKDFPSLGFKELFLTGTRLSNGTLKVFSADSDPNMSLVDPVRITMSFPFAFMPVLYQGEYYADGGIASNYPMDIFNQDRFLTHGVNDAKVNPCTLGLLVDSKSEIESRWGVKRKDKDKLKALSFAKNIIKGLHNRANDLKNAYSINSIQIYDNDLDTLNFSLSQGNIAELIKSGRTALQDYVDNYMSDDVVYNHLPSYDSVYDKYYAKRPEELVRIIEQKLWPAIQEMNTFINVLKKIDFNSEIAEIDLQLSPYPQSEKDKQYRIYLQLEEMANELENLERDNQIVEKKLRSYEIKKRNLIASIDEATTKNQPDKVVTLSNSLVELIKKLSIAEDHKQALQHERDIIRLNFHEIKKEINKEIYTLIEQKQKIQYIFNSQMITKLRKTETLLQEHMDIALKALASYKNDYPDPRINEKIESQLYEIKQEYYHEVVKIYREKDHFEEPVITQKAKDRSDFFADVVQYGISIPQAKVLTQHFFATQDIVSRNKNHDLLALQDGTILREMRSKFFWKLLMEEMTKQKLIDEHDDEQYEQVRQFWQNTVNAYLTEDPTISQGYAEYLAKEKTIKHWQAIMLRIRQQLYKTYKREAKQHVDIEYALNLRDLTKRLGRGKWGDLVLVTNRQDLKRNLMNTEKVNGETVGIVNTEYSVATIITKSIKGRYKATNNFYTMPPIEAHILMPKKLNLQNPIKKTKELIILFNQPKVKNKDDEYALASTFAMRRKKQFSQHKDELMKKILLSIRQMQEEGLQPKDAHFKITIAGEGLAGQDAQYLLAAVFEEINKKPYSEEYSQIHSIDLVLTDPSNVSESLAFKTAASLHSLKEKRPDLHVKGYNLIHQKTIGNHRRSKSRLNYLGQANVLSKASPTDATVIADFRDKHDSHHQHQILTNMNNPEMLQKELNETKLQSSNIFTRQINLFAKKLKRIGKFICYDLIPKFVGFMANKVTTIDPLQSFMAPITRIINHFKKKDQIKYKVPAWTASLHNQPVAANAAPVKVVKKEGTWKEKIKEVVDETSASQRLKRPSKPPIENIVLEGGGTIACGYLGALQQLKKDGLLNDLKRVAGGSGGGVIATLFAIGYTPEELSDAVINQFNVKDYLDEPYPFANLSTLFEVQGHEIGLGSIVSLFLNKGLYKGDSFKKLIEKLIEIKLEKNLKTILFSQLTSEERLLLEKVPAFLPELERNKRIDDYLGSKLIDLKNKYHIKQLGRITFSQAERLAKDYPALNIKELFLTGTKVSDASLKVFSAQSEPDMAIADGTRITMSFPGAFIPVKHNEEFYVDGAVAGAYPMHLFDEEKYLSHGVNDAMVNPCTLGLIVDSKDDIEARWGMLPKEPGELQFSTMISKVLDSIKDRFSTIRGKYNINTIQISDNISSTNTYQGTNKLNFNLTKQDKYQLVKNGQKAIQFYTEQYANEGVQYSHKEFYDNVTEKYVSKSVPELQRILQEELRPILSQIEQVEPVMRSNQLRLQHELNQLDVQLGTYEGRALLTRQISNLNATQHLWSLAAKNLAVARQDLAVLDEIIAKNTLAKKQLLAPYTVDGSLVPNDVVERVRGYDQALASIQERAEIATTRFKRLEAKESALNKELQVIQGNIDSHDKSWVDKVIAKIHCENDLDLIDQAYQGKSDILQEQNVVIRALRNKGGEVPTPSQAEIRSRTKPILLSTDSAKIPPQLIIYNVPKDTFAMQIAPFFPLHEWGHFSNVNSHKFHHKTHVDEMIEVSYNDKGQLQLSGLPLQKLRQVANAFDLVDCELQANSASEAILFLQAMHTDGFDIARIKKVQIQAASLPDLEQVVYEIKNSQQLSLKTRPPNYK
jgi:predicted acylesterase/phospholipase RssA